MYGKYLNVILQKHKKIAEVNRDGRMKKYTNKSDRDKNRQDTLHFIFKQQGFCEKMNRDASSLFLSLPLLFVDFFILPSLLAF